MTILMTGLCEKGADQIWKQCNDALYAQGVTWLEEAAYAGDAEAWFFLGHCYSWGDGAVDGNAAHCDFPGGSCRAGVRMNVTCGGLRREVPGQC